MTLLKKHKYIVTFVIHSDNRLDSMDVFSMRTAVNNWVEKKLDEKVIVEVVGRTSIDCEQVMEEIERAKKYWKENA